MGLNNACVPWSQVKEKEKFEKLLALPSALDSLADKYSRFDLATGEPTHDKDGNELEGKVRVRRQPEQHELHRHHQHDAFCCVRWQCAAGEVGKASKDSHRLRGATTSRQFAALLLSTPAQVQGRAE